MLEETLARDEQLTIQQHVDGCPVCQARLDEMLDGGADEQLPLLALSSDLMLASGQPELAPVEPRDEVFGFLEAPLDSASLGRLAHYEVIEVIGRGGMGIVFKARDCRLQRIVAIKVLAPEISTSDTARQRFLREAQAAAAVSHDHVITIYAVEPGPVPYLVMELIDGQSLQQKIERSSPLELVEILRIGNQIACGLAAAHAQGLIHRDIKPANILLQNGIQRVQITDFGLARAADDAGITGTGEVAGTPQYMSPEQALGRSVDARSDLFSLGSVLYAMATGHSPFRGESTVAVLRRVCDEAPLPIREINPNVPPWLAATIDRLLDKNPDQRFQTAAEVAQLFSDHLANAQRPQLAQRAVGTRPLQRHLGRRAALGLMVLLLALGGLIMVLGFTNLRETIFRPFARKKAAAPDVAVIAASRPAPTPLPLGGPPFANVPFDSNQATAHQQAWADYLGVPVEFTNSVGMKLRLIPPGEFVMGSTPAEVAEALEIGEDPLYRDSVHSEAPQHRVRLSEPWFLGVHEVTQEQYETVSGENPSYFFSQGSGQYEVTDLDTRNFPVERVTWNQAAHFCNTLSRREGLAERYAWNGEACKLEAGSGYHLPTEAQWEFACRAGTTTRYWFAATGERLSVYGWHKANAESRTHTVGQLTPNPFGLYDLNGNVSEWCHDGWQLGYYTQFTQQTAVDPAGPAEDFFFRTLRGGSFRYGPLNNRSSRRNVGGPNYMSDFVGLRLALTVNGVKALLQSRAQEPPVLRERVGGGIFHREPP
jgi:formylglycine-generating enzyme required for sulfatase activity/tRNA A-37 threonylcarbamoyl transferase component Bud32